MLFNFEYLNKKEEKKNNFIEPNPRYQTSACIYFRHCSIIDTNLVSVKVETKHTKKTQNSNDIHKSTSSIVNL